MGRGTGKCGRGQRMGRDEAGMGKEGQGGGKGCGVIMLSRFRAVRSVNRQC